MKIVIAAIILLMPCPGVFLAQKGRAGSGYYPLGYARDIWTGQVTAFDDEQRTLTLTHVSGKNAETFVASIPDAPYEWARDSSRNRVVQFPYNKTLKYQTFKYDGSGDAASLLPDSEMDTLGTGMFHRPNPPDSDRITSFADFMGRRVTVYYTVRDRDVGGKVKFNDVWRIFIWPIKKK